MDSPPDAAKNFEPLRSFMEGRFRVLPLEVGDCPAHFFMAAPLEKALADLPAALHPSQGRMASGRGTTPAAALASCLGETAELLSTVFWGDEELIASSPEQLGARAIGPEEIVLPSAARAPSCRLAPDQTVEWVEVRSLDGEEIRYLPAALAYIGYPDPAGTNANFAADSNGCASATGKPQALVTAFLELVERDATAIWWLGRHQRPAVDMERLEDPTLSALSDWHQRVGRRHHLLDLTTDLEVPVFAAVSSDATGRQIALGFAADFSPRRAAVAAFTEMLQIEISLAAYAGRPEGHRDPAISRWLSDVTLESAPYLLPSGEAPADWHRAESLGQADQTTERVAGIVERQGLKLWALDMTRGEIGLPTVRLLCPGLRHFKGGTGPGRLYETPLRLGWRTTPLREHDLNPTPLAI